MKTFFHKPFYPLITSFLLLSFHQIYAQTIISAGEVKGIWTKQGSPYQIKGDINIPLDTTLTIEPGVKVEFCGLYKLNVQGNLIAEGNEKDSIVFTISDTSGFNSAEKHGWNGIRFDRRPIKWDTLEFKLPKNEKLSKIIKGKVTDQKPDTGIRIRLTLKVEDLVNDTIVNDSIFKNKKYSMLEYCRFEYGTAIAGMKPYVFGGAVYIYRYSNLIISKCTFINNKAYAGGAIYCKEAAPIIKNNTINGCYAESSGGAMVFIHSGPFINNNIISNNRSGYNGGAVLFYESNPYVLNNTILHNIATNIGGGIFSEKRFSSFITIKKYLPVDKLKFKRDTVVKEKVTATFLLPENTESSNGRFINNIICNNTAKSGGGIGFYATAPDFNNNTVSYNKAEKDGGGIFCFYSAPVLINSIIYNNETYDGEGQIYLYGNSSPSISYCDVEMGIAGIKTDTSFKDSFEYVNNIQEDPLFNNPNTYDFSLKDKSSCIDAGTPDVSGLGLALVDISGKSRVINDLIDIGAVEYSQSFQSNKKSTQEEKSEDNIVNDLIVTVYPNPNYGIFSVTLHNNTNKNIQINVFTQKGQIIYQRVFQTEGWFEGQIDISDSLSGIYIIQIISDNHILYNNEIIID